MIHESENKGFKEGRAVAEYLETHPCRNPTPSGSPCADCIAEAIIVADDEAEREAIDAETRERAEAFALEISK